MDFLHRAQRQENAYAEVLAAVPGPREAARIFGASVTSRGIQPLFVRITNRSEVPLRLKAGANRTQWIDSGPPATLPVKAGKRFYRVKQIEY